MQYYVIIYQMQMDSDDIENTNKQYRARKYY
jgi:hypothetical protein